MATGEKMNECNFFDKVIFLKKYLLKCCVDWSVTYSK